MSIQSEINRILSFRDESFAVVESKGVTVASGAIIDDLPDYIGQITGENMMINTLVPSTVLASRPKLVGQTSNTTVASAASAVTAEHGIRVGVASSIYPYITFGNVSITGATAGMNGLIAGETYTLSFDCDAKLFSGDPDAGTNYELLAYLYDNHANSEAFAISLYSTIHVYASSDTSDRGVLVENLRCEFTFTVPEATTKLYLSVRPSSTTGSLYASGDYIELRNLKMEKGSFATAWTPAPTDCDNVVSPESLSVTANGTYTAPSGTAYNEVMVAVPQDSDLAGDEVATWEVGSFSGTTGGNLSSSTRIRTTDYLPASIAGISVNTDGYQFGVYGWNSSGTYLGIWTGSGWATSISGNWQTSVTLSDCTNAMKFKLLLRKTDDSAASTAWAEYLTCSVDAILTGPLSVTLNGTYTAPSGTAYDEVTVNVSGGTTPTGTLEISENGTFDVAAYATALVNVPGLEYETGTWEPSTDIARGTISFSNTHTGVPFLVALSDATGTTDGTANTNYTFTFFDFYNAFGVGSPNSASMFRYATATYVYRSSSSIGVGGAHCTTNSDSTSASSTAYSRYWVTPTGFMPYTNSTSRYWRAGRTYKWYAVWKPAA